MTDYKCLQIIKHALRNYIDRPDASPEDIAEEQQVLDQVTKELDELKLKYGIE